MVTFVQKKKKKKEYEMNSENLYSLESESFVHVLLSQTAVTITVVTSTTAWRAENNWRNIKM